MYEKIKKWYQVYHIWNAEMVKQAYDKGLITEEQYNNIINGKKQSRLWLLFLYKISQVP